MVIHKNWFWGRSGFRFVSNYTCPLACGSTNDISAEVWLKLDWVASLVCTRGCVYCVCVCVCLPVCSMHHSPLLCLDKEFLVQHGSHWAADSCHSSSQRGSGIQVDIGTACSPSPLPVVSLPVDCSVPFPVFACKFHHLPDVKVAGALVEQLGWLGCYLLNHLDFVARSGSHDHFLAGRCCYGGKRLGCDGEQSHGLFERQMRCVLGLEVELGATETVLVTGFSVFAGWKMKDSLLQSQQGNRVSFLGCKQLLDPQHGYSHWPPNHWNDILQ